MLNIAGFLATVELKEIICAKAGMMDRVFLNGIVSERFVQ